MRRQKALIMVSIETNATDPARLSINRKKFALLRQLTQICLMYKGFMETR
jgi:hypothetical protein